MIDVDKTRSVLDRIAHAKDLVGLVRELVLASGGTWIDAATVDMAFLFEVNLHGVCGFGLSASAAIDNLIANAEDVVANQDEFGIHFPKIWFETFDFSRRRFSEKRTGTPVALQNPCRGQGRNLRIH